MPDPTPDSKAERFAALHARAGLFLVPNPWDAGSARLLESLGFEALATTSAGMAFAQARPDRSLPESTMVEALRRIVEATALPVTADLQNGFGDHPDDAARAVRRAAEAGCCGCSIEDDSGTPGARTYPFSLAVERVQAAAEAARGLASPFVLTARCDRFFAGEPDLDDTVRRLKAYEAAGADVLYAPGLRRKAQVQLVMAELTRPVNVLLAGGEEEFDVAWLQAAGVRRVSVGGALARVAYGAMMKAARELREQGSFGASRDVAMPGRELNALFSADRRSQ